MCLQGKIFSYDLLTLQFCVMEIIVVEILHLQPFPLVT